MTTFLKGDTTAEMTLAIAEGFDYSDKVVCLEYQGVRRLFSGAAAGDSVTFSFTARETAAMSLGTYPMRVWIEDLHGNVVTVCSTAPKLRCTNNPAEVRTDGAIEIGGGVKWEKITGKPTTLSGYGITDKVVKTVNGNAPDENGNIEVEEGGDEGLAPEFIANHLYFYGELVKHEDTLYKCDALDGYSGEWDENYFSETTASAALQDIRQTMAQKAFVARFYNGAVGEPYKVNDIRWWDIGQYGTLQRCTSGGDAETAEWEETTIGDVLSLIAEGSWTRQYVLVSGAESDEQMPTLMDFDEGRIVYDSGDEEQMPTAQKLLGGDMVAELYMAGENRQGIEIYHDGVIIVKPYGGETQVFEWSVVISEIMPEQTVLAKIYAAVQGDSEKPILFVELS